MNKNILSKLIFIMTFCPGFSSQLRLHSESVVTPDEQFKTANRLYEKSEFEEALQTYQALLREGFEGAALYFNLGNTYFKKGERGKAILWYERAAQLAPRDTDIQFNLNLANSHIKDQHKDILTHVALFFTGKEISITFLLLVWIVFGLWGSLIIGWINDENWAKLSLSLSQILLVISLAWMGFYWKYQHQNIGIITSPPGEVRNGPGADYGVGFTVPEGSKVVILDKRPDWYQIGVPQQGLKGWLPATEVEPIKINSGLLS
jgi:TPR repeat protein